MGIYIKSMRMPPGCLYCCFADEFGDCSCKLDEPCACELDKPDNRPDWCPIVHVPPHGRLIEESAIDLSKYENAANYALHNGKGNILYFSGVLACAQAITQDVRRAPTIIPAEEEIAVMLTADRLKELPAMKIERPVVHGEWKLNNDGSGTCSVCYFTQSSVWDDDGWQNFCGHCGADMRKEKTDEIH